MTRAVLSGLGTFGGGKAAVIREEDDDGLLLEAVVFNRLEHFSNRTVHGFDHATVDGVLLHGAVLARPLSSEGGFESLLLGASLVFFDQRLGRHQRSVHRVEGQVDEEGFVLIGGDELSSLLGETVGQVLAIWAVGEVGVPVFP